MPFTLTAAVLPRRVDRQQGTLGKQGCRSEHSVWPGNDVLSSEKLLKFSDSLKNKYMSVQELRSTSMLSRYSGIFLISLKKIYYKINL